MQIISSVVFLHNCQPGSLRQQREEKTTGMLQYIFFTFEEGSIGSYDTAVANKCFDEKSKDNIQFATLDMSISHLMKWLTRQKHKPIRQGEEIRVSLIFDHDCMERNPYQFAFHLLEHVDKKFRFLCCDVLSPDRVTIKKRELWTLHPQCCKTCCFLRSWK